MDATSALLAGILAATVLVAIVHAMSASAGR